MKKYFVLSMVVSATTFCKTDNLYLNEVSPNWKWEKVCSSRKVPCYRGTFRKDKVKVSAFMSAYQFDKKSQNTLCSEHYLAMKKNSKVESFENKKEYCYWMLSGNHHFLITRNQFVNIYTFSANEGSKVSKEELITFIKRVKK